MSPPAAPRFSRGADPLAGWHRVDLAPEGEAPDLEIIWLHGWGQTHESLKRLAEFFSRRATCRLYDQPGFGETARLDKGAGTADYADALASELAALPRPAKRVIIGHSFGFRIAVQMAANHGSLVDGIVAIAGAGLKRERSAAWKLRAASIKFLGKFAGFMDGVFKTKMRAKWSNRFGSADYRNAGELRETFVAVVNENLIEESRSAQCPALLIYGEEDTETPAEIGRKFASLIPNSKFHELPGFGHLDILGRGAAQCQTLIDEFLKERIGG